MAASDRRPFRLRPVAAVLAAAALAVACSAIAALVLLRSARHDLVTTARKLEVDSPELLRAIEHAGDAERARLALARALLAAELGPQATGAPTLARQRLETARTLAAEVLAARPASWRAATVEGTATYLNWSRDRDPRLLQEYHRWEEPLLLARRLAPARDEPVRALVGAYLELWPALTETKRNLARQLAARAFRDQPTFERLIGPWLAVAGTGPAALAAIPDQPWAWRRLATALADSGDWSGFCAARARARDALEEDLRRRLTEGRRLVDRDELLAARSELFGLVAEAPTDLRFARLVDQALRAVPPGPAGRDIAPALRAWLRWQLDSGAGGPLDRAPSNAIAPGRPAGLSFAAVARLRSAAFPGGAQRDDLPLAARAALATPRDGKDPIARAGRIERRADALWSPAWGRYFIDKARVLVAAGRPTEARETLDRVHPSWQESPLYLLALREWSEHSGRPRTDDDDAAAAFERLAARSWPGTAWSWDGPVAELFALTRGSRPAGGWRIGIADAGAGGGAVEVAVDGASMGCRPVRAGDTLEIQEKVGAGLHRLTLKTVSGERVWPGPVALLSPSFAR